MCDAVQRVNIYIFVNLTQYFFFSPSAYSGTLSRILMHRFLIMFGITKIVPFLFSLFYASDTQWFNNLSVFYETQE
jgi:hypothetical protein